MNFTKALLALVAGLVAALSVAHATQPPVDPVGEVTAKKPPVPSFQPGAQVNLAITLKAPRDWNLNYMVPFRFEFEEEYLKDAPIIVKQRTWDFNIKSYLPEATFVVPIKLRLDLVDGEVKIPIPVACSVCESTGEMCTFCMETMTVRIMVKAEKADGDTKNQAQTKGVLETTYRLSLP